MAGVRFVRPKILFIRLPGCSGCRAQARVLKTFAAAHPEFRVIPTDLVNAALHWPDQNVKLPEGFPALVHVGPGGRLKTRVGFLDLPDLERWIEDINA